MIILKPTKGLVKVLDIDYDLISYIFNKFIIVKKTTVLKIERSKYKYSFYCDDRKIIGIYTAGGVSLKFIISTLLHEIRHVLQIMQKHNNLDYTYTSYWKYYNSPEEKDARKFERLTAEVVRIYKSHKIIEEKIKKYKLDSFTELWYNEKVDSNDLQLKITNKKKEKKDGIH